LSDPTAGTDVFALDAADLVDPATAPATGDRQSPTPDPYDPIAAAEGEETASFPNEPDSFVRVSATNDALVGSHPMPEVERVTWESEGWALDGVVYHDPEVDPTDGPHPLVVAIHGGPISYDEPVFSFAHAALTSRGYVVFRPNYRGGSSRGRAFSEELRGAWGTAEVTDIAAGLESLVDRGVADPDRVFGYGFSYGGIAQGFLVTQEPDLFTAAAPEHGIYDLRSAFGTDDTHVWIENEYGLPWEEPEAFDASSAILDAGAIETPLLVMAGGNDWRCPPTQSEQLYVAAKKGGTDAKLVVYPEEHHNIGDPDRAIHRLESILDWYETHDPAIDGRDTDGDAAADAATADGDADADDDTGADDADADDDRRHGQS
ncbi:alpha/beta hydrolase family protein, partial [Halorubrum tibetense]